MEIKPVVMVLADISGYTQFMKNHRLNLIHAEKIITDLIESILDESEHPLTISKLEGDAVFFYAELADHAPQAVIDSVIRQVMAFFATFKRREAEIVSCSVCVCEACNTSEKLQLKAIIHTGEVAIKQVRQFEELAGEDVILLHRLLKNSIPADEYLLLTERVWQAASDLPGWPSEERTEQAEGIGEVQVIAYYLDEAPAPDPEQIEATLWDKVRHFWRMEVYQFGRMLGLIQPRGEFRNLPEGEA